jgi:hypothetical protein
MTNESLLLDWGRKNARNLGMEVKCLRLLPEARVPALAIAATRVRDKKR